MTNSEFKSYYFKDREHWKLGVFSNLQTADDSGLIINAGFEIESVTDSGKNDATPALDFDPCNHLYWVRPSSGELIRLHDFGPQTVGIPVDAKGATKLAVGRERLWLQTSSGINSYALRGLHPLRQLRSHRSIVDMAGDGCNGVWWLEGGDLRDATLFHVDRFGCFASRPIPLSMSLKRAALDVSCCGRKIVVLDQEIPESERIADPCGREKAHWRLIIIDCINNPIIDNIGTLDANFKPQKITIDCDQNIHLIDPETAWLWTLNLEGILLARHRLQLPEGCLPIWGIAAGDHITVSTACGIANLRPAETTGQQDTERESTLLRMRRSRSLGLSSKGRCSPDTA